MFVALGVLAAIAAVLALCEGVLITRAALDICESPGAQRRGDCILVLCHFLERDGRLSDEFRIRLDVAEALSSYGTGLPIVVNGGRTHGTSISQGRAAHDYLRQLNVLEENIRWSEEGHDTLDEIRLAHGFCRRNGLREVIVVSQFLQAMQAHVAFRRLGLACAIVTTPRHEKGMKYVVMRFALILPTWWDPYGNGKIFGPPLNWVRRRRQFGPGGQEVSSQER